MAVSSSHVVADAEVQVKKSPDRRISIRVVYEGVAVFKFSPTPDVFCVNGAVVADEAALARLAPLFTMEGKFTSVHDALYQKPITHPLLSTGLNPHIQKFMERKAPKPIAIRTANHVREDVSIVHYPKPELKDTVILCARLA